MSTGSLSANFPAQIARVAMRAQKSLEVVCRHLRKDVFRVCHVKFQHANACRCCSHLKRDRPLSFMSIHWSIEEPGRTFSGRSGTAPQRSSKTGARRLLIQICILHTSGHPFFHMHMVQLQTSICRRRKALTGRASCSWCLGSRVYQEKPAAGQPQNRTSRTTYET